MTLHADNPNPNALERLRRRLMPLVDKMNLDPRYVVRVVSGCFGFKTEKGWAVGWLAFGNAMSQSLYYNGMFYFRLCLPLWIGLGLRWRGTGIGREYFQFGIGWKTSGQAGLNFRIQSDASAAAGTTGPNSGQAIGWAEGTK